MSTIRVGDNENLENALRRFKRKCSRDGIIGHHRGSPQEGVLRKAFREEEKEGGSSQKEKQKLRIRTVTEVTVFFLRKMSKLGEKSKKRSKKAWSGR